MQVQTFIVSACPREILFLLKQHSDSSLVRHSFPISVLQTALTLTTLLRGHMITSSQKKSSILFTLQVDFVQWHSSQAFSYNYWASGALFPLGWLSIEDGSQRLLASLISGQPGKSQDCRQEREREKHRWVPATFCDTKYLDSTTPRENSTAMLFSWVSYPLSVLWFQVKWWAFFFPPLKMEKVTEFSFYLVCVHYSFKNASSSGTPPPCHPCPFSVVALMPSRGKNSCLVWCWLWRTGACTGFSHLRASLPSESWCSLYGPYYELRRRGPFPTWRVTVFSCCLWSEDSIRPSILEFRGYLSKHTLWYEHGKDAGGILLST